MAKRIDGVITYGSFEMEPVMMNDVESWWFINGAWKKMDHLEMFMNASVLPKEVFDERFGVLPPVPAEAFQPAYEAD